MIDLRIYRAALLPAIVAFVVMMFSLGPVPAKISSRLAPSGIDGDRAAATADELAKLAPDRTPGSAADARAAKLVLTRLRAVQGGQVTEQRFKARVKGKDAVLDNVVLLLPGQSDRRVVLLAHRDVAGGPGLASSGAATGALLEIASTFSGSTHQKTLVFVSTDGGTAAAVGARRFIEDYPGNEQVDVSIALEQPGAHTLSQPFIIPWSAGVQSTSMQLVTSAERAVRDEVGKPAGRMGTFGQVVQLALPNGLGEQSVLVKKGLDAVSISSAGERPLPRRLDGPGSIDPTSLGEFGRATLSLLLALDAAPRPLAHGPKLYVGVAGNLLPAWTLRLLALTLILPVAAAAVDGLARMLRRGRNMAWPIAWALGCALPFVSALIAFRVFSLAGLIPSPAFPFDPGGYHPGRDGAVALVLTALVLLVVTYLYRPFNVPRGAPSEALGIAVGLVTAVAMLVLWAINPYMALLGVPALHLWQVPALQRFRPTVAVTVGCLCAGLVLPLLVLIQLAGRLKLGLGVFWELLLQVSGGQIGPGQALTLCVLAGCAVAMLGAARLRRLEHLAEQPPGEKRRPSRKPGKSRFSLRRGRGPRLDRENPFGLEPID